MTVRVPRTDLAWAGLVFLVALWVRVRFLASPPYGDEPLFYYGAAHPFHLSDRITDVAGTHYTPVGFLERPAYYALMWLPSQFGFEAFRSTAAVLGALLAPAGFALARSRTGRVGAVAAGLGIAILPELAMWTAFGLTEAAMTLALVALALARLHGHAGWATAFAFLAVWTKEVAYLAVLALLAVDLWQASQAHRVEGLARWPPRLGKRWRSMLWPAVLAPAPLVLAMVLGFPRPGVADPGHAWQVLDRAFVTPWLIPVLLVGVAFPRARPLALWGLGAGSALVAMHVVLGTAIPQWYYVPAHLFAVVGACASAPEAARIGLRQARAWLGPVSVAPAFATALLLLAVAFAPAGASRDALRPGAGDGGEPLGERIRIETTERDQDREAAFAALPAGAVDLVTLGVDFPPHLHPLLGKAGHLWLLWWPTYEPGRFTAQQVASRVEADGTWTLVGDRASSLHTTALLDTYADCVTVREGRFTIVEGWRCPGRAERLAEASSHQPW